MELTFTDVGTFVFVVMMNCSDTHPGRKLMEVSFPEGALTQTFKTTWPQLAQSRSHKTGGEKSKYIFKETQRALLSENI